jgi:peptidoglycan/xylan/chitin deacetylase (PgdA/CDA1 family)
MTLFEYMKNISKHMIIIYFVLCMLIPSINMYSQQGHANCFVYHRIGDSRYPSTNISTETFRDQLEYLRDHNFRVLSLGTVVGLLVNGSNIPAKTVVITIDDAYESFYVNGLPILEQFGYPATLFINTNSVGGSDFMTWEEIDDARDRGIEIGNHSHSHQHFLNISEDIKKEEALRQDIDITHELFTAHLGSQPDIFSYPYGEYDKVMMKVLSENGYKGAAAQYSGVLYPGTNLFSIPRFPMGGPYATLEGFTGKLQALPFKIISQSPENILLDENPPLLQIEIPINTIDLNSLQCFVNGEQICKLEIIKGEHVISLIAKSEQVLHGRRSLYTITARSKNNTGWCWYSHVWVNTEVAEE